MGLHLLCNQAWNNLLNLYVCVLLTPTRRGCRSYRLLCPMRRADNMLCWMLNKLFPRRWVPSYKNSYNFKVKSLSSSSTGYPKSFFLHYPLMTEIKPNVLLLLERTKGRERSSSRRFTRVQSSSSFSSASRHKRASMLNKGRSPVCGEYLTMSITVVIVIF